MNYSDDYTQPKTPFYGDETGEIFALREDDYSRKVDHHERNFETQSGYLVLVKRLGSRLALSFKRQIGTPPTSSIFLTPDEAQILANVLTYNSNEQSLLEKPAFKTTANIEEEQNKLSKISYSRPRSKPIVTILTTLFLISIVLCSVLAISFYQTQLPK